MSCNCNNCSSYFANLVSAARQNHKKKYTVVQGDYLKVNVMCIPICGDIGVEVHENEDQLITVVCGTATVKLGRTRREADCIRRLNAGDSVLIPAGIWHNVCNSGNGQLQLISVYGYGNANHDCGCNTNNDCGCSASNDCGCSANNDCGCGANNDCGCSTSNDCGNVVNNGCGCNQATAYSDCNTVFNAGNCDWNNVQTQDNGCSCAIDSGC